MGGNNRQKKGHSSFSFFSFFKSKRSTRKYLDHNFDHASIWEEVSSAGKVWPSDEDKGRHWVGEPGIDRKAKDFIDRIHRNRFLETERQTVTVHPNAATKASA